MLYADCETGSARNHVQRAAKRAGFKVEKFAGLENSSFHRKLYENTYVEPMGKRKKKKERKKERERERERGGKVTNDKWREGYIPFFIYGMIELVKSSADCFDSEAWFLIIHNYPNLTLCREDLSCLKHGKKIGVFDYRTFSRASLACSILKTWSQHCRWVYIILFMFYYAFMLFIWQYGLKICYSVSLLFLSPWK